LVIGFVSLPKRRPLLTSSRDKTRMQIQFDRRPKFDPKGGIEMELWRAMDGRGPDPFWIFSYWHSWRIRPA